MKTLLIWGICLLVLSVQSRTLKTRAVTFTATDLGDAIMDANVQYTLSPTEVDSIDLRPMFSISPENHPIGQFVTTRNVSGEGEKLTFYLPECKTVDNLLNFAVTTDKKCFSTLIADENGINTGLARYFDNTLGYCAHVISPGTRIDLTLSASEYLQYCFDHFEVRGGFWVFNADAKGRNHDFARKKLLRRILFDKNKDYFVYIPQDKTIAEFVMDCALRIQNDENENDFIREIASTLQTPHVPNTQKVEWNELWSEISKYSINLVGQPQCVKNPELANVAKFISNLRDYAIWAIFQKLNVSFKDLAKKPNLISKSEILKDILTITYQELANEIFRALEPQRRLEDIFIDIDELLRSPISIKLYNISANQSAKFYKCEMKSKEFEDKLKKLLRNNRFTLRITKVFGMGMIAENVFQQFGSSFKCLNFPYIVEDSLTNYELIVDYAAFIGAKVDSNQDDAAVYNQFFQMFLSKKYLDEYKACLLSKHRSGKSKNGSNDDDDGDESNKSRSWIYILAFGVPLLVATAIGIPVFLYRRQGKKKWPF